jgi:hypothetical protein
MATSRDCVVSLAVLTRILWYTPCLLEHRWCYVCSTRAASVCVVSERRNGWRGTLTIRYPSGWDIPVHKILMVLSVRDDYTSRCTPVVRHALQVGWSCDASHVLPTAPY